MRFIQAVASADQVDQDDASVFHLNLDHVLRFSIDHFDIRADVADEDQRYVIEMQTAEEAPTEAMTMDELKIEMNRYKYFAPITFDNPSVALAWLLKSKDAHGPVTWFGEHYEALPSHRHYSIEVPLWKAGDYLFTVQLKYGVVDSDNNWHERGADEQEHEPLTDVKFHTRSIFIRGNADELGEVQKRAMRELKVLAQQWADEVQEPVNGGLVSFTYTEDEKQLGGMRFGDMPMVQVKPYLKSRLEISNGTTQDSTVYRGAASVMDVRVTGDSVPHIREDHPLKLEVAWKDGQLVDAMSVVNDPALKDVLLQLTPEQLADTIVGMLKAEQDAQGPSNDLERAMQVPVSEDEIGQDEYDHVQKILGRNGVTKNIVLSKADALTFLKVMQRDGLPDALEFAQDTVKPDEDEDGVTAKV